MRKHLRPIRSLLSLIGAVVVVSSCDNATTRVVSPQTAAAEGFYTLVTVNDTVLPRTLQKETNYLLEIVSDTIVLVADGRWSDITHYREVDGTTITLARNSISGTFDVSETTIRFSSPGSDGFTGVLENGTITINLGSKAVYKK